MIYKIYTIRDSKIEAFIQPFFARTEGEARRMFINASDTGNFAKHHADYQMYYLGEFHDDTGDFTPCSPVLIMTGTEAQNENIVMGDINREPNTF